MASRLTLAWLPIGDGALAIGPRPGKRSYPVLEHRGCTAVLSLLSESEGALDLRDEALARGWAWHWLPLAGAEPPAEKHDAHYRRELEALVEVIRGGQRMYVHCAAGLHRTGMITSALLLIAEGEAVDLAARIHELRPMTAQELREDRVAWARRVTGRG